MRGWFITLEHFNGVMAGSKFAKGVGVQPRTNGLRLRAKAQHNGWMGGRQYRVTHGACKCIYGGSLPVLPLSPGVVTSFWRLAGGSGCAQAAWPPHCCPPTPLRTTPHQLPLTLWRPQPQLAELPALAEAALPPHCRAASAPSTTDSSWRAASVGLSTANRPDTTAAPAQPAATVSAALLVLTPPMDTTAQGAGKKKHQTKCGHSTQPGRAHNNNGQPGTAQRPKAAELFAAAHTPGMLTALQISASRSSPITSAAAEG